MGETTLTVARVWSGRPPAEALADNRPAWLLCRCGAYLFALPLANVVETMRPLPIRAVAGAPHYVQGMAIVRGVPVAVVDAGVLLGGEVTRCERLVTVATGSRTIALAVEAVQGICAVGPEQLSELPPLLRNVASEMVAAIGTLDAEVLFCLRAARIVPEDVLARLGAEEPRA